MDTVPSAPTPRSRSVRALGAGLVLAIVLAVGLLGGWVAASQRSSASEGHGEDAAHEHGDGPPRLSPRTLANLGVEVREVALSDHCPARDVPGTVVAPPAAARPVHPPVGGVVLRVLVVPGQVVEAGRPLVEVLRDPFPRPALSLTDAVLRPLNEEFHETVAGLRTAAQAHAIAKEELERVRRALAPRGAGEAPVLAGKVEVELAYEERRTRSALENARHEAERHGLDAPQIAAIEAGTGGVPDLAPVREVLERNRLWSPAADAVLGALPAGVKDLPFALAILGELSGANLLTPALAEALRERPRLAAQFLDVAGLLQQGVTVPGLLALDDRGALEAVVELRAPAASEGPADYDVRAVHVRPGQRAEAGTAAVELADLRLVHLRLTPAGPDLAALAAALASGEAITAEALLPGTGPSLEGLHVLRIEAAPDADAGHAAAVVEVTNEPLASRVGEDDRAFRSWRLREGLRYVAHVPLGCLPERFVLPAEAITYRGPDAIVLVDDGDSFRQVAVRLEHLDAKVAVVANDGAIFPGDRVVVKGAYALSLALQPASGGGVDPHAGHSH
jgi:multidrug efflux pump subunit AcrA (membrane-fusion protein)